MIYNQDREKTPKSKRGMATMQSLIDSAEKVFYSKGYVNTTIRDIVSEAGVALGTFYIYFDNKREIYDYLLSQYSHLIRYNISLEIQKQKPKNRIEEERIGLRTYLQIVKENKCIYNIIWESLFIDKEAFMNYYVKFSENYYHRLEEGKTKNTVRDYDSRVMAFFLMGVSNFIGLNWVLFNDSSSEELDRITDQVVNMLSNGLFI